MKLTATSIVQAALDLVNRSGLDGFTTRKLATELGVRSPSLYHHFGSMEELIDLMALELMQRHIIHIEDRDRWEEWLRCFAMKGREMALSCRDGARILTAPVPRSQIREDIANRHARYLIRQGFSHDAAYRALGLVSSFVAGWTLNEQNRHDWLTSVMDLEANFCRCIDDIISGIQQNFVPHVDV